MKSCQVLMLSRELFVVAVGQLVGDVMVFRGKGWLGGMRGENASRISRGRNGK